MANKKQQKADLLGMSPQSARNKLHKMVLLELLKRLNCNYCARCGRPLHNASDLAIEHIYPWEQDVRLYWDLNNIQIGCVGCPLASDSIGEEIMENLVDIKLLNEAGEELPKYRHDGRYYFGGCKGQNYTIKIRNRHNRRVEVVVSVDGLDVITGKKADYTKQGGYMIDAYGTTTITGFRRSLETVAAFQFTESDNPHHEAYASLKDMPDNIGVIGVAVFKEVEPLFGYGSIFDIYNQPPNPKPYPAPWRQPPIWRHTINQQPIAYLSAGESKTYCSASSLASEPLIGSTQPEPQIGTAYGEVLKSSCKEVYFARQSQTPNLIVECEYDTVENLRRRGIVEANREGRSRSAFPGVSDVRPGFAQPPVKK